MGLGSGPGSGIGLGLGRGLKLGEHLGTARGRRVLEPAHALAVGNISPGRCETTVGFAVAEIEGLAAVGRRALVRAGLQASEGMGMGMYRGRGAIVHACRCLGAAGGW